LLATQFNLDAAVSRREASKHRYRYFAA